MKTVEIFLYTFSAVMGILVGMGLFVIGLQEHLAAVALPGLIAAMGGIFSATMVIKNET